MKAEEFDRKFDEGKEDIIQYLDLSQMKRPGLEQQPLNINFPVWMIAAIIMGFVSGTIAFKIKSIFLRKIGI